MRAIALQDHRGRFGELYTGQVYDTDACAVWHDALEAGVLIPESSATAEDVRETASEETTVEDRAPEAKQQVKREGKSVETARKRPAAREKR